MNLQNHRTDKTAAEEGKWFEYDGSRFLIAAHNTPKYQKALTKHGKKNQAALRREDHEAISSMAVEVMADAILLGWENVKDGDKDFPYSRSNAIVLLSSAMEFKAFVENSSMNLANFILESEAADKATLKSGPELATGMGGASGLPGGTEGGSAEPGGNTAGPTE